MTTAQRDGTDLTEERDGARPARGRARGRAAATLCALAAAALCAASPGRAPAQTAGGAAPQAVEPRLVTIATGGESGVYYFAGGAICSALNAGRWRHGIRCIVESTAGSIDNLQRLRRGDVDFAIVQSDWQAEARRGGSVFEGRGADLSLRSVMSLYPEPFTVIARADSGIARFGDLLGRRVSIGPARSGGRATMEVAMKEEGWSEADFAVLADLDVTELNRAMCGEDVDAAVMVIAHPNLAVESLMQTCDVRLVPVEPEMVRRMTQDRPYVFPYALPGGAYPGQPAGVETFALAATLVTSSGTPPSVVRELTKAVMEALPEFRARHPAFEEFTQEQMLSEGLTAPLHGGAARYYEEAGLR